MDKNILLLENAWKVIALIYILMYLVPPAIKNLEPHVNPIRVQRFSADHGINIQIKLYIVCKLYDAMQKL